MTKKAIQEKPQKEHTTHVWERSLRIANEAKKSALEQREKMKEYFRQTNPAYAAMLKAQEDRKAKQRG